MKPRNYLRSYLKSVRDSHRLNAHESSLPFKRKNVCITSRYCPFSVVAHSVRRIALSAERTASDKASIHSLCPMLHALCPMPFIQRTVLQNSLASDLTLTVTLEIHNSHSTLSTAFPFCSSGILAWSLLMMKAREGRTATLAWRWRSIGVME